MKIAYMDDNYSDFLLMLDTARKIGHSVTYIEKTSDISDCFDIVFVDVNMPEDSGFYVAKQIKKKHPDMVVVLISGAVPSDEHDVDMKVADMFITKPVNITTLRTSLQLVKEAL